jgi:hypothetical protein
MKFPPRPGTHFPIPRRRPSVTLSRSVTELDAAISRIAEYFHSALGVPIRGSCSQMLQFCAASSVNVALSAQQMSRFGTR